MKGRKLYVVDLTEAITQALEWEDSGVDDALGVATFLASWLDAAGYTVTAPGDEPVRQPPRPRRCGARGSSYSAALAPFCYLPAGHEGCHRDGHSGTEWAR